MKIIDIEKDHRMGSHCLTTALATVFKYHGIEMSEDMLLGLGSGLGFTYVRQAENYIFGGRSGNLEHNIGNALGLGITEYKSNNFEIAWAYEKEMLRNNYPVICQGNMRYLPYLVEKLNYKGNDLSEHKFLLIGFDECKGEVYLLDYLWNKRITLQLTEFYKSQNLDIKSYDNRNVTIVIDFPEHIFPIEYAILDAIRFNVQQMKYPVAYGLGLKSIKRFFKELFQWPEILSEKRLRQELYMAYMVFEKTGTGGGNFRRMYSRFLKECYELLGEDALFNASRVYVELGRLWKKFSKKLYIASYSEELYDFFNNSLIHREAQEILNLEYDGIAWLEKL